MSVFIAIRGGAVRGLLRAARQLNSSTLLGAAAFVAPRNPSERSQVTYSAVRHHAPGSRGFAAALSTAAQQPASDLIRPLIHGDQAVTVERIEQLANVLNPPHAALDYARAMLEHRFSDAYSIWECLPDVRPSLEMLPAPDPRKLHGTIAVVLPGSPSGTYGKEIDAHGLVARSGLLPPSEDEALTIGRRFDIALLNKDRYTQLVQSETPPTAVWGEIVTMETCRHLGLPAVSDRPVRFGLPRMELPTSDYTYIPVGAVPWCFSQGLRPTLYNGDFYLGDELYGSEGYDNKHLLQQAADVVDSYFKHDVFFCHAALSHWLQSGSIEARGRLHEILSWTGRQFSLALEKRWDSLPAQG